MLSNGKKRFYSISADFTEDVIKNDENDT